VSLYKGFTTSRGLNYYCYVAPARELKPTLLFLHGFPSTSYDWRHQVAFFVKKGYGLIVPDLLGYGGTAKPVDVEAYKSNLIVEDIIDILDAEGTQKVVSIGHDWGCRIGSRLANLYPERVLALAFLAVGYLPPSPEFDISNFQALSKQVFGYELLGYWFLFTEDGADKIIESHWDSFFSLLWPHDPQTWRTDFGPAGAAKAWLLADKQTPLPSYITEEDKRIQTELLLKDGLNAPLNWYKVWTSGLVVEEDKLIPADRYDIQQPIFFGGCKRDYVCLPALGQANLAKHGKDVTYKEFDADHWVMLSHADEVNEELLAWIESKV